MRSVSGVMPHFSAIEVIAAHSDVYWSRCFCTSLIARSRTSAGYLFDLVITPSSQGLESPTFPGRFNALIPEFFRSLIYQGRIGNSGGIYGDFVGSGTKKFSYV
jgi:hypothetical protein